jgi:hypothetical protein
MNRATKIFGALIEAATRRSFSAGQAMNFSIENKRIWMGARLRIRAAFVRCGRRDLVELPEGSVFGLSKYRSFILETSPVSGQD